MTSQRKIEANRRNAQLSTGPKSLAGRARARRNALKSGIYAKTVLLPSENAAAYAALRVQMFQNFQPKGPIEEGLVELIIADLWRLDRLLRIENEFIHHAQSARAQRRKEWTFHSSIGAFLDDLRGEPEAPNAAASPGCQNTPHASGLNLGLGAVDGGEPNAACLLDAHVSPVSQTPMEDIARQRRQTNREMLRNISALTALQCQIGCARLPHTFIARPD